MSAEMCFCELTSRTVRGKWWNTKVSPCRWCVHCMYCASIYAKRHQSAEAMYNSEKMKPLALVVVELHLSEDISQSISRKFWNSVATTLLTILSTHKFCQGTIKILWSWFWGNIFSQKSPMLHDPNIQYHSYIVLYDYYNPTIAVRPLLNYPPWHYTFNLFIKGSFCVKPLYQYNLRNGNSKISSKSVGLKVSVI